MAIYGVDFFGLSKYGSNPGVEYDVTPFLATPIDYGTILLTWNQPSNTYSHYRLLRSAVGYAVRETEGALLGDDTTLLGSTFVDTTALPGVRYYYTLFFEDGSNNWWRGGSTNALTVGNHGYTQWLYSWIPNYYKFVGEDLLNLEGNTENAYLYNFLKTFGWGYDIIKQYYDELLHVNDISSTSVSNLENLALQIGMPFVYTTSVSNMRKAVGGWAYEMREKGTLESLKSLIALSTGWDADIFVGYNMMLDEDQASFVNPAYPGWDPQFAYIVNDRVTFNGYIFQNIVAAYGNAQAPPLTPTNNTWWDYVTNTSSTYMNNPATGNPGTWEAINMSTLLDAGAATVQLGVGFQSPTNGSIYYSNALQTNYTGSAANIGLRSVSYLTGQTTMDPYQPILDGIPIPQVFNNYDPAVVYEPGALVFYQGYTYQAQIATLAVAPTGLPTNNTSWTCIGIDKAIMFMASYYVHTADFVGTNAAVPAIPFVEWYDEFGMLITRYLLQASGGLQLGWDSFSAPFGDINGRTMPFGENGDSYTWVTFTGGFNVFNGLDGAVAPVDQTVRSLATIDTLSTTGDFYLTFRSAVTSGSLAQGLVVRLSNATNYVKATRTQLIKVVAGTPTVLFTYSTAAVNNDRIRVNITTNTYTVYVNGVSVGTSTDAFNSSATQAGIVVE